MKGPEAHSDVMTIDAKIVNDNHEVFKWGAEPTIRLIVGPDREEFIVDRGLISERCPFFLNAFSGNFVESQTRVFRFPDDDPDRFRDLCSWLRTDNILEIEPKPTWIWLVKLWLFGDKYHVDELQNDIVEALYAKYAANVDGINISFETLDYVAEHASQRSLLRRMFADMLTNGISLQHLPSRIDQIPSEFLQDMCIALKSTTSANGPTNISLLTNPLSTYYTSSGACKANAMPRSTERSEIPTGLCCESDDNECGPIKDVMHICTNHNLTLCEDCRHAGRGHSKKMISFTTAPYQDQFSGKSTVIDGHVNDSGFYCDGPRCNPTGEELTQRPTYQHWAILSGDRYHCLECDNIDYCTVCFRGPLECKDAGHKMLRIRPTHVRKVPLTEEVTTTLRQERLEKGVCWRCGESGHGTADCEATVAVIAPDVLMED